MSEPPVKDLSLTQTTREREAHMRPLSFGLIKRLLTYTGPYAAKRNWLIAIVIVRSIQLPILAWAIGAVVSGPIADGDTTGLFWGVLGFGLFALFVDVVHHFRQRLALELGEGVVHDLRNAIFEHLMRMPMGFYNKTKIGRLISRMTSDVEAVRAGVQDVLFISLVQIGQMMGAAALMLYFDAVLFSVMLALAPILWGINRYFRQKLSRETRAVQESFSRVTSTLAESVGGIRVTQGYVRQRVNAGIFRGLAEDHSRNNMGLARTSAIFIPLLELNSQFFIALLLFLGGYRVFLPEGGMEIGALIQFFFLANLFFQPIQSLGGVYNRALVAMAGAERVFRLLDNKPEWEDDPDAEDLDHIEGRVEFRNVTFGYDPERPILRNVDLYAKPGETVALVGHTGSGKSSIINLLSKFYLPTEGEIHIDGREIRKITSHSLHRNMGVVQQTNFLFSGTILENILFSKPEATLDEVWAAAEKLDCTQFLRDLPEGLETHVGERGSGLSLGQRQVVCFIRAMLADPSILILDEATSSVDTMTEHKLQESLSLLLEGRTSFVVAHRLSTIRDADQVLVLDQGRIVERGRHEELLKLDGTYAELYRQFGHAAKGGIGTQPPAHP